MKKIFLFGVLALFILVGFVNADTTYDFSATYEGINIWGYGADYINSNPPPTGNPPTGFTLEDKTTNGGFDANDGIHVSEGIGLALYETFHLFKVDLIENPVDIDSIEWTWIGKISDATEMTIYFYLWDYTNSEWDECTTSTQSVSDITKTCFSTSNDYFKDGETTFIAYGSAGPFNPSMLTNYIELEVLADTSTPPTEPCDYYVGDPVFNLPQITATKTYDDSPTHKMYLACLYGGVDGISGYEEMITTDKCRESIQTFDPDTPGNYTYSLSVMYRERQWNSVTHQWETIDSGTDVNLDYNFEVCGIPDDTSGWNDFINWIQGLLCSLFGIFC